MRWYSPGHLYMYAYEMTCVLKHVCMLDAYLSKYPVINNLKITSAG